MTIKSWAHCCQAWGEFVREAQISTHPCPDETGLIWNQYRIQPNVAALVTIVARLIQTKSWREFTGRFISLLREGRLHQVQ